MPDASSFTMRPAVLHDLDALTAIDALCFPPGIAYPRAEIAALLRMRSAITLVAERSGAIAGFASLRLLPPRTSAQRGELVTIEVVPEFRRTRIGWQLHQALEDWLRTAAGTGIELHVAVDNTAAIRFYQRLGYTLTARVPRYYLETIDAWRMEKAVA